MNLSSRLQLRDALFWAVIVGVIALSAFMVLTFVGANISAYILAYLMRPLFIAFKPRFGIVLSSLLCIAIAILLIVVPIVFISTQILNQVGGISDGKGISTIIDAFVAQPLLKSFHVDSIGLKSWILAALQTVVDSTLESIPQFGISVVITLNGMFYLLCNWESLVLRLKNYLPFRNNEKIITQLGAKADAIIHGHVLISLLEGIIAFVGFSLAGVEGSLIFAVFIFVLAFVPSIGPVLIWVPLAAYYFSIGHYLSMWGILVTGAVLMIGIEFLLYTRFVGSRSKIHPFIMLLGVLGGISVFGIFGFIIGPLLLASSIEIVEAAIESHDSRGKKY